ncbi:MAG: 4Fe-4S dicluster domain-containing protein [Calditrichaeota bacterium]|nr:4Fe-4S dicluster domain-containing protein [Calditrichota bacterium]
MTLKDIEQNGVIGAGGAGFPTHIKLNSQPEVVIMNAAECEPLLHKDMEMLLHFPDQILHGLMDVIRLTGAKKGIIGIKNKNRKVIDLLNSKISDPIKVVELDDVYPAGDEITLIYMTTGRIVQPGNLPVSVGCVVQNVETLYNIASNKPVVEKFISVAGAVENPATVKVPVGISFREVLKNFSITVVDYNVRSGGLMMGELETDLDKPVSKKTGALIVLPSGHHCVTMYNRFATDHDTDRIAKAGCDQCYFCTEFCPRYLLGHPVRPETAMRNRMFTREEYPMIDPGNFSCCECNLCTMYACPEGLDPKGATVIEKRLLKAQDIKWQGNDVSVHPMFEYRKVPTKKLMQRLDVLMFDDKGPLMDLEFLPEFVDIPLDQHIGAPAKSIVREGDLVKKYQLIAKSMANVSSNVHASIDGKIKQITEKKITILREK